MAPTPVMVAWQGVSRVVGEKGRFIFNVVASLAALERDLIRARATTGLQAARARGRTARGAQRGGERKGEGRLSANQVAKRLGMAKSTLYSYLRHRGVAIGAYAKKRPRQVRGLNEAKGAKPLA